MTTSQFLSSLSAGVNVGDVVCVSTDTNNGNRQAVTLATPAALLIAGAARGICLEPAYPGHNVTCADPDELVSPTVTGVPSAQGVARVGATGQVQVVAALAPGDFPLGNVSQFGVLSFEPIFALSASASAIAAALIAIPTLANLAALPGPATINVYYVQQVEALYVFVAGSVTPADGVTSLSPTGGVAGRFILSSEEIMTHATGGPDDSASLNTLLTLVAGKASLRFASELFAITNSLKCPSKTTARLSSGTILNSMMVPTINQQNSVFDVDDDQTLRTHATTLNANIVAGSYTCVLVSAVGYAIGDDFIIGGPNGPQVGYTIANLVGATITTERPILKGFVAGTPVIKSNGFIRDVEITSDKGGVIQGTGDHAFHSVMGQRIFLRGLYVKSSFSSTALDFDWATVNSKIQDVTLENTAFASFGILVEDAEHTQIQTASISGAFGTGLAFVSVDDCAATDVSVTGANSCYDILADAGDATWGCRGVIFTRCRALKGIADGVNINNTGGPNGSGIELINCDIEYNAVGVVVNYDNVLISGGFIGNNVNAAIINSANAVGTKVVGTAFQNNQSANPNDIFTGTLSIGAGGQIQLENITTIETNPLFALGVNCTVSVNHWRHTCNSGLQNAAIYVAAGAPKVTVEDVILNFAGAGAKFGFLTVSNATFYVDKISSIGILTDLSFWSGGPIIQYGNQGLISLGGDATALVNYGTVVAAGTGNPQTVVAACVSTDRPPTFTRTVTGGSVFNAPVVAMGNGSFTATFSGTDTSTYAWRL